MLIKLRKCRVGIAFVGTAKIGEQTFSYYICLFEINDIVEGDTPDTVVNKLLARHNDYSKMISIVVLATISGITRQSTHIITNLNRYFTVRVIF